jgi:hypothetical protein
MEMQVYIIRKVKQTLLNKEVYGITVLTFPQLALCTYGLPASFKGTMENGDLGRYF